MAPALPVIEDQRRAVADSGVRASRLSRLLDRYGGSAMLRLLGLTRRRPLPARPDRIGLCVINAIGDTLLVTAIAADLRHRFPAAKITLLVSPANRFVVPLISDVDDCLVIPLFRPHAAIAMLRAARFDLLIDFSPWPRITAVYTALSGACGIGFNTEGQARHFAYDVAVRHAADRHELENYRALLAPLGIDGTAMPRVAIPPEARTGWRAERPAGPFIVLHPWAGGENGWRREWPTGRWVALARHLATHGFASVVTGGPADRPAAQALVAAAAQHGVTIQEIAGRFTLAQTAALLEQAAGIVSVNTGVMHLAACLDIPLVALHGPTDPVRWGPLSARARVVLPSEGPSAYLNLGFEYPPNAVDCMPAISVDAVWASLAPLLGITHAP